MPKKIEQETQIITATPDIGLGNPVETKAITAILEKAGFDVVAQYPKGFWVQLGSKFHIGMTASTDRTIEYAEKSEKERNSLKTKPLLFELSRFIKKMLQQYPDAEFFLTPQNMLGELATQIELHGKKFTVIMILPDAMGKLSPKRPATEKQHQAAYLVWNENAYQIMKNTLKLKDVQLIDMVDPLLGFPRLTKQHIEALGFREIYDRGNICVIKLSGSGGDHNLINAAISALWKNSKVRSIVFPGQEKTGKKLIARSDQRQVFGKHEQPTPVVKQSLDEGLFYNISREMIPGQQLFLAYPSEQFKHMMLLSKVGRHPKVVWLPPRGEHEVINLANYILLSVQQGIPATVCIPKKHHEYLEKKLENFGFSMPIHFELVDPGKLSQEHFKPVPVWRETLKRLSPTQAVKNIMLGKK